MRISKVFFMHKSRSLGTDEKQYFKNIGLEKRDGQTPCRKVTLYIRVHGVVAYYYAIAAAARDVIVGSLVQCEGEFRKSFDDIICIYIYINIGTRCSRGGLQW